MKKTEFVGLYLDKELYDKLMNAVDIDRRNKSSFIRVSIEERVERFILNENKGKN